jgi:glycosyltransferase involved in cell wall biosynthesis
MLKIAYLCGSESWGGLEMNQYRNALWMKERGHSVTVLGRAGSRLEQICGESNIPFRAIGRHRKYYDYGAARKIAAILRELGAQHLIIRDVKDMSVSVIAKSGIRGLKVHYFMEMQLGVAKKGLPHTIRFRKLDTWSCPLEWLKEQVETMTNMPKDGIVHIPSGLDRSSLRSGITKEEARQKTGLPQEMRLIGLAGRFDPQKGQLLLLQAAALSDNKDCGFVLLGEPTYNEGNAYESQVLRFIGENGLKNRVYIRPFMNDIGVFYKAIDAFVMASKAETFGMVTIESMACGTPVIGSNAGGTPELLGHGRFGYLFEPLSASDLAEKINVFLSDPQRFPPGELMQAIEKFDHAKVCAAVEKRLLETQKTV